MLEEEIRYYEDHQKELLAKSPGKFVLIKGDKLLGVFDTQEEALAAGGRLFGLESFLVRRVEKETALVWLDSYSRFVKPSCLKQSSGDRTSAIA